MTKKEYIVVAVSVFYEGFGWTDKATNLTFMPTKAIQPVRISKNKDLSGIYQSYRKNHLLLLEGTFDEKDMRAEHSLPDDKAIIKELEAALKEAKAQTVDTSAIEAVEKEKEKAVTDLKEVKELFFTSHTFTAEELKHSFYTVEILKEILDAKAIEYTEKETKAALRKKVIG